LIRRVWTFLRAAWGGAGFGLAMTAVEVWMNAARIMSLGMHSPLPMVTSGAAMMIGLATLVGAATVGAARRGRGWHWLAMTIVWIAIQEYAAPQGRDGRLFVLVMPMGGVALVAMAAWVGRRVAWLPVTLGALLLLGGIVAPEVAARRHTMPPLDAAPITVVRPDAPDVLVVVLDTVRADHLGAYGYARATSPHFDALAHEGTLFLDAVSPATWSLPSHASLFTGRFPSSHGAHDEHMLLATGIPTLAERFAAAGYDTRSFTANAWITDSLGMTRGFRWTDEAWRNGDVARTFQSMHRLLDRLGYGAMDKGGAQVATNVEQWLAARSPDDRPAFTFVNFIEAQFPYHQLPAEWLGRFTTKSRRALRGVSTQLMMAEFGGTPPTGPDVVEQATAMYDAGVAYADDLLGRLVAALRRRGTLDRTVLVVLADHGELLGEHGQFGHGRSVYEPVLHVPLLVRYAPRIPAGRRVATPVSPAGVFATVLDLAGLPPEASVQVGSLVPVIDGGPHPGPVLAEQFASILGSAIDTDDALLDKRARFRVYRVGRQKLVDAEPGGTVLFDLGTDPDEAHDIAMPERHRVAMLRESLDAWRERVGLPDLRAPVGRQPPRPSTGPRASASAKSATSRRARSRASRPLSDDRVRSSGEIHRHAATRRSAHVGVADDVEVAIESDDRRRHRPVELAVMAEPVLRSGPVVAEEHEVGRVGREQRGRARDPRRRTTERFVVDDVRARPERDDGRGGAHALVRDDARAVAIDDEQVEGVVRREVGGQAARERGERQRPA
jgi:arylsulfatase A-like enzyme